MKATGIIILNYNNFLDTIKCVESVEQFNTANIKYVIVDNGSTDANAVPKIKQFVGNRFQGKSLIINEGDTAPSSLPDVTFLISKVNNGYACGNNKGLKILEKDHDVDRILILNNDILFVEDIIPNLIKLQDSLNDCAIMSPLLLKKDGKEFDYNCARLDPSCGKLIRTNFLMPYYWIVKKRYDLIFRKQMLLMSYTYPYPNFFAVELPSGACMLIKKDIFKQIEYFDPNTFLYYEENILFRKIQAIGMRNYISTNSRCIHLGAVSTSKSPTPVIAKMQYNSCKYYIRTYLKPSKITYGLFRLSMLWIEMFEKIKSIIKSY